MYWEEVYDMYEYASNMDVIEKSEDMKFNYLLHAQTKDAISHWNDLPIPFPARDWIPPKKRSPEPALFNKFKTKGAVMTPEKQKEVKNMLARLKETQRKARELQFGKYYTN